MLMYTSRSFKRGFSFMFWYYFHIQSVLFDFPKFLRASYLISKGLLIVSHCQRYINPNNRNPNSIILGMQAKTYLYCNSINCDQSRVKPIINKLYQVHCNIRIFSNLSKLNVPSIFHFEFERGVRYIYIYINPSNQGLSPIMLGVQAKTHTCIANLINCVQSRIKPIINQLYQVHCNTIFVLHSYIKDVVFRGFFHGCRSLNQIMDVTLCVLVLLYFMLSLTTIFLYLLQLF